MNHSLDSALLRYFCSVCRTGKIHAAASELGVSASAVSQAIHKLEEICGTVLFERNRNHPLTLTGAGRKLLTQASPIIEALDRLEQSLDSGTQTASDIRIGLMDGLGATISPILMRSIYAEMYTPAMISAPDEVLLSRLKNEEVDVCVFGGGLLSESGWERVPIIEEKYFGISSPDLPSPRNLEELRQFAVMHPQVSFSEKTLGRVPADRFLFNHGLQTANRISTTSSYGLVGIVKEARGWGLVTPVNLLSAGSYASKVRIWTIPEMETEHISRRIWVLGRQTKVKEIETIARIASGVFRREALPAIRQISETLFRGVTVLFS